MYLALRLVAALVVAAISLPAPAQAEEAIRSVAFHDDGQAHDPDTDAIVDGYIGLAWPFCPTDRMPCAQTQLVWVEMEVSLDAYTRVRNDPHESALTIVRRTSDDFGQIAAALEAHFDASGVSSDASRVAFVQGMVQAVLYAYDETTGWTEYPKFGIEMFVDRQGDCDDAAIATGTLVHALGYEAWFVRWRRPVGSGHLSTAVTPTRGDLSGVKPPPGSLMVPGEGGRALLHVDGTGSKAGCGRANAHCQELGWNQWHLQGLSPTTVARVDAPDLEQQIPTSAWSNGGLNSPRRQKIDRRGSDPKEVEAELTRRAPRGERNRDWMLRQGIPEGDVDSYLGTGPSDAALIPIVVGSSVGSLILLGGWWGRRRARLRRVAEARGRRKAREF
jgi:hypothetical protein